VAKLLLAETERILKAKGIKFKAHDQGVHELAVLGYDPEFGARPLKRVIQKKVTNIIAKKILANEVQRRDVVVLNKDGNIEIEKAEGL
jgi:ATP-dependent Clp protease ATP-binding subunit ClpB